MSSSQVRNQRSEQSIMDDIRELEKKLAAWRAASGMQTVKRHLEKHKDKQMDVNDLTLMSICGTEKASQEAVTGVLESAVVAALLLSISVPLTISPPEAIDELESDDWKKILHIYGWGLMSGAGAMMILYARIYTTAMSRAVRHSDKLRIQLAGNAFNEGLMMTYLLFIFFLVGFLADAVTYYGTINGILITVLISCMLVFAVTMGIKYISAGHIEYGWRRNRVGRDDPVDDKLAFEILQKKIELASNIKDHAESVFKWSANEKNTHSIGLSDRGKTIFNLE